MKKQEVKFIDISLCKEYDISLNELCALIKDHQEDIQDIPFDYSNVDYGALQKKKFIKVIEDERGDHVIFRQKGNDLIDAVFDRDIKVQAKPSKKQMNVDMLTRLPELRAKWKGLKAGSMGDLKGCKTKLTRWMNENPEYTFDDIIGAADAYIESLGGDYRYLQRADYFIYKQEGNREETSRLSAFIDEANSSTSQGDWTTQLS